MLVNQKVKSAIANRECWSDCNQAFIFRFSMSTLPVIVYADSIQDALDYLSDETQMLESSSLTLETMLEYDQDGWSYVYAGYGCEAFDLTDLYVAIRPAKSVRNGYQVSLPAMDYKLVG